MIGAGILLPALIGLRPKRSKGLLIDLPGTERDRRPDRFHRTQHRRISQLYPLPLALLRNLAGLS